MQIAGNFVRKDGRPCLDITITNRSAAPLSAFAIKFNVNSFGVGPSQPQIQVIMPGQSADALLPLASHPSMLSTSSPVSPFIQIAIKNNVGVFYYQMNLSLQILFQENGQQSREDYLQLWKSIQDEHLKDIQNITSSDSTLIQAKFQQKKNLFLHCKT